MKIVKQVPISGNAKLGCRRCGGWGTIREHGKRVTCDLCFGTGTDPRHNDDPEQGVPANANGD